MLQFATLNDSEDTAIKSQIMTIKHLEITNCDIKIRKQTKAFNPC